MPGLLIALAGGLVVQMNAPGTALGAWTAVYLTVALGWGRLIGASSRYHPEPDMQVLLGFAAVAYLAALPVLVFGLPILMAAAILPLGLLGLRVRCGGARPMAGFAPCLLAATGFALLWSLDTASRYEDFAAGAALRAWSDVFIHAGTISEFGDPRASGRGFSALADVPNVLYHTIGHAVGGLAMRVTLLPPFTIIAGFWLPFGIFLTALGILALGRSLGGLPVAALSLTGLALLPDAAGYGLRQGFLSFHWMLETSPGNLYALPVALASVALLAQWTREGSRAALLLSAAMLAAVFMLRAHVFVWLLVPWAITVWLCLPWPGRRWRWGLLVLGCLAAIPALFWLGRADIAASGYPRFLSIYMEVLHTQQGPTGYDGLYAWLVGMVGAIAALPLGVALALLGMGGVWLLTFLAGAIHAARHGRLQAVDAFPWALLAWASALMLLAPTPFNSDFTEFRQRGFVLVFLILLIWSARFTVLLLPRLDRAVPAGITACVALVAMPFWLPEAKPARMAWASGHAVVQPPPGLIAAARWISADATIGESFLISGQRASETVFDDATVVLGYSGVPAWLSRPGLMALSGPPRSIIAGERLARATAIHAEPDRAKALGELQTARVGFYLSPVTAMPAWDVDGQHAQFRAGDFRGWRIHPAP